MIEAQVVRDVCEHLTWRTIRLGLLKNANEYCKAMESANIQIGHCAVGILDKPALTFAAKETDVDLVVLSGAQLDFKKVAQYGEICARALGFGLELCPAEVGPALRLAYKDQPPGGWLNIAMAPITNSDGILRVFGLDTLGRQLWLSGFRGYPDYQWHPQYRFVFVRPR